MTIETNEALLAKVKDAKVLLSKDADSAAALLSKAAEDAKALLSKAAKTAEVLLGKGVTDAVTLLSKATMTAEVLLARVKRLEGIIPICSYCKKIRDDQNSWRQLEEYLSENSEALFSHGICPHCAEKLMSNRSKL